MFETGTRVYLSTYARFLAIAMAEGEARPRDMMQLCNTIHHAGYMPAPVLQLARQLQGTVPSMRRHTWEAALAAIQHDQLDYDVWMDLSHEMSPGEPVIEAVALRVEYMADDYVYLHFMFCLTAEEAAILDPELPMICIGMLPGSTDMEIQRLRAERANPRIDVNINVDAIHPTAEQVAAFGDAMRPILARMVAQNADRLMGFGSRVLRPGEGDELTRDSPEQRLVDNFGPSSSQVDTFIQHIVNRPSLLGLSRPSDRPMQIHVRRPEPELQRYRIVSRRYRVPEAFFEQRASEPVPQRVLDIFGRPMTSDGRQAMDELRRLLEYCPAAVRFMDEVRANPEATALNLAVQYSVPRREYGISIDHRLPWDGTTHEYVEGLPTDRGHFSILGVDYSPSGSSSPELETPPEAKRQSGRRLKRNKSTTPKEESKDVSHDQHQSGKDPIHQRFARRARRAEQARHSDESDRER